jgi:hypothetical protein
VVLVLLHSIEVEEEDEGEHDLRLKVHFARIKR